MNQKLTVFVLIVLAVNIKAGIGVGYSDPQPLPVELTTFSVNTVGDNVELNWETATEVNNFGFDIERQMQETSIKNQDKSKKWEKLGFVNGHGNSNSPKYYTFTDSDKLSGKVQYRLKQIDIDGKFSYSSIIEVEIELPIEFNLAQNYPNPFNPSTIISYSIPSNMEQQISNVKLIVYDVLGNELATLVNEQQQAGNYKVTFNASNISNGVYFYRIIADNFTEMKKMILLK